MYVEKEMKAERLVEVKPALIRDPVAFMDTTVQAMAEKIDSDYLYVVKKMVLPQLGDIAPVGLKEVRILSALLFYDKPLAPINIVSILRFDPATVTRSSILLEDQRMIDRHENVIDGRGILMTLTDKGAALAQKYIDTVQEVFGELENEMPVSLEDSTKLEILNSFLKASRRSESMREICKNRIRARRFKKTG